MNRLLDRLNAELADQRQRGMREKVVIDYHNLLLIIEDYERLEMLERVEYEKDDRHMALEQKLYDIIRAIFHTKGRDAVTTVLAVMTPVLEDLRQIEDMRQGLKHLKAGYRK